MPPNYIRTNEDVQTFANQNNKPYSLSLRNDGDTDFLIAGNRLKNGQTATISAPSEGGSIDLRSLNIQSVTIDTNTDQWTAGTLLIVQPSYLDNFQMKSICN
jgi:hypothetical protein